MKTKRKVKCPICGLPCIQVRKYTDGSIAAFHEMTCIQVRKYTDGSIAAFHEMKYTKGFKAVMPEVTKSCYQGGK